MASRNGLNPKIRGQKGIGFNRALPAPFGFGNGLQGDGFNDYLFANLTGKEITTSAHTIEYWVKPTASTNSVWVISFAGDNGTMCGLYASNTTFEIYENGGRPHQHDITTLRDTRIHVVLSVTTTTCSVFINGFPYELNKPFIPNTYFKYLTVGGAITAFGGAYESFSNLHIDEFRFYTEAISPYDVMVNYNNGLGNNPCRTEFLKVWYQFENFEQLDFSALQDGSDMRLGIRDISDNKNHAQQFNMITDSSNLNYVLKPF